ncbi:hypothetical protein C1X59_18960 [Pseudomonas sp. FW215-R2]|jgi:hypothetical protein|uniref:hypothetical protein n=1 Tax=Pseudomonas TaxID=286 RepID=UPI000BC92FC8|nr:MULTISPECIES: hypothetical protein [Pseudomonas]PCR95701.1 hypothetical protein CP336_14445 [Pseudomonas fluorescens]PMW98922.1 hypothetical protein C1X59_18960 [Pseudomonas sp. FW215-R2]PMX06913.1 hypothetical protein C1X60_22640 [Pseudomonas sp. FW215-L1]PMX24447.1 hypothetical protein C1X57_08380 [Pseudomonas sp. FW215-E1]PNA26417.1 hypothetical protein C1X58_21060 [Pseudomonas sp. FW215-R4]
MLKNRSGSGRNPEIVEQERRRSESNDGWLERAFKDLGQPDLKKTTLLVLAGGKDQLATRVRIAQSALRNDRLPSYWSDCFLLKIKDDGLSGAKVFHVPLIQPARPFATERNGVVEEDLAFLSNKDEWPNLALLAFPVDQRDVVSKLKRFMIDRNSLDALEHILKWLAYAWGVSRTPNPVHEDMGFPSACMLEVAFSAAQLDLTPGLASKVSCPEAIWSTACYWQKYYEQSRGAVPLGRYVIGHTYDIDDGRPKRGK